MKKFNLKYEVMLLMSASLCLTACSQAQTEPSVQTSAVQETSSGETETETESVSTQTETSGTESAEKEWHEVEINGNKFMTDGYLVQEPECTVDIDTANFSDFGEHFTEEYPVTVDTYKLLEGTDYEMEVYHIASENPGETVYIVGGVHGDERAGWFAGKLLRKATISSGELYVLAPANAKGAKELKRYVDEDDMNRCFPGKADGTPGEQVANAIYTDIADKNPGFLFDLHEAIIYTEGRDFLGSSLIFTDLEKMGDMFFDLLFATQDGELCSVPFGYNGPGPIGSINNTVTTNLGIPTITVETFRGFDIYQRVSDQLDIVEYVLKYKGMR